jgi:hypothetical protein
MPFRIKLFAILFLICLSASHIFAQDDPKKVLGEVTVFAEDPIYKNIRSLSSPTDAFSGDYATVDNLVLKRTRLFLRSRVGKSIL